MAMKGLVILAALALTGCGGGGGNPGTCHGSALVCGGVEPGPGPGPGPGPDSAVGRYKGTTTTGRTANTLVLQGGQLWVLYGQSGSASLLGGALTGTYAASQGAITSVDVAEFSAAAGTVVRGSLDGNYVTEETIAASVMTGGQLGGFAGAYDPDSGEDAELADAVGSYTGTLSVTDGSDRAAVVVAANGTVTGESASGCNITGTLLPNTSARSYSLNVSVAGGVCGNESITMVGVAIIEGSRIYSAGFDGGRIEGFTFAGGR